MSFLIAVHVNEGIVLASDRRTTYTNTTKTKDGREIQRIGVHMTNSTDKTFICPNGAGLSACGDAAMLGKPITGYIQEMIRTRIKPDTRIKDMPQIITDYFGGFKEKPAAQFMIAGYEETENGKEQSIYSVSLKNNFTKQEETAAQGAVWAGEGLTMARLFSSVAIKNPDGTYTDLKFEEVAWKYFTLQDAVDFARYAVETTIQTMHFKNVVETVGGNVDILVITPDETRWLAKEELS